MVRGQSIEPESSQQSITLPMQQQCHHQWQYASLSDGRLPFLMSNLSHMTTLPYGDLTIGECTNGSAPVIHFVSREHPILLDIDKNSCDRNNPNTSS